MTGVFADALVAILAAMLIIAATGDLRTRTIPNWLNGAIAVAAIPFWIASGLDPWPDMALQIGIAAFVFVLFAIAFHFGAMGGGDVKMVTALSLWLSLGAVVKLLVIMSIAGGVLTVVMLVRDRIAKSGKKLEIPYGVAIAFGGLAILTQRFLNHFV